MHFHEKKLDNGLQVIAELNPHVHSVAAGFFVRTGSRDETAEISGVSHFLEHMAFKGSRRYMADDVNRIFDELGAKHNASTGEEVTLYYAAVLPEYLPQAFELLSTLLRPSLRVDDFDMEKKVILEEIGMYEDQPGFTVYETLMQSHFAGHPLGQSILGTTESIGALRQEQMKRYHDEHYLAGNITLAIAGHSDWSEIERLVDEHCSDWPSGRHARPVEEARPGGGTKVIVKEGNVQEHVMQMGPAPPASSEMRFAAQLLSVIVGDDSGSRLYWELVDPGHAEVADVGYAEYDGSGAWLTYLSCIPEKTKSNLAAIHAIYDDINRNGVTETEVEQARNKVASRIVLRGERPMGRLPSLGGNWIYREEYRSVQDDLETLKSLSTADIRELLDAYPLGYTTTAAVGPLASLNGE